MIGNLKSSLEQQGLHVDKDALDLFWKFVYRRHLIWYKRFVLNRPAPWTNDWILAKFKFTNMYRELDRGTIYLLDHITNTGNTDMEEVFNIIVYRMFNRIATYDHIGFQKLKDCKRTIEWPAFRATFDKLRLYGQSHPLYTDAHMVCAYEHFPGKDKLERFEYIFQKVLDNLIPLMHLVHNSDSLGVAHKFLTTIPGIGPFLAYEIAVDISYCEWNDLHEDEWVNPGPGCQRGLRKIMENIKPKDCQRAITLIRDWQDDEWLRLDLQFPAIAYKGRKLTLRNVEHDLCEFFKYAKVKTGKGRPRCVFNVVTQADTELHNRLRG